MSRTDKTTSGLLRPGLKQSLRPILILVVIGLCTQGWTEEPASADKAEESRATLPTASTFTPPVASLDEGRDPFYPTSTRILAEAKPVDTQQSFEPIKLVLKGISGTKSRPLALINNRTFTVGDEQEVGVAGNRVTVKCLAIEGMKAIVLVQGQVRELELREELRAQIQPGSITVEGVTVDKDL
jgi:hypothetical protein